MNGDGRHDLVCNNVCNGVLWLDFASSTGQFLGSDWNWPRHFCKASNQKLHILDLNGDGRDDLLCQTTSTGFVEADMANTVGEFWSVNWQGPFSRWCSGTGRTLYTGNFNGGSRDDLLCLSTDGTLSAEYSTLPL